MYEFISFMCIAKPSTVVGTVEPVLQTQHRVSIAGVNWNITHSIARSYKLSLNFPHKTLTPLFYDHDWQFNWAALVDSPMVDSDGLGDVE